MGISVRKGIAINITVDADALQLLRQLAPSKTRLGSTVSELIRAEVSRREERQRMTRELMEGTIPCAS